MAPADVLIISVEAPVDDVDERVIDDTLELTVDEPQFAQSLALSSPAQAKRRRGEEAKRRRGEEARRGEGPGGIHMRKTVLLNSQGQLFAAVAEATKTNSDFAFVSAILRRP